MEKPVEKPGPRTYNLKIYPEFFQYIVDGSKTFEIRREDDKVFQVGDFLIFNEYEPEFKNYTGRLWNAKITYLTRDPRFVKEGYVVMSIRDI